LISLPAFFVWAGESVCEARKKAAMSESEWLKWGRFEKD
jgi:hypothetical protein